jgi:uncharacterized protein YyaL (SSP411 family)
MTRADHALLTLSLDAELFSRSRGKLDMETRSNVAKAAHDAALLHAYDQDLMARQLAPDGLMHHARLTKQVRLLQPVLAAVLQDDLAGTKFTEILTAAELHWQGLMEVAPIGGHG